MKIYWISLKPFPLIKYLSRKYMRDGQPSTLAGLNFNQKVFISKKCALNRMFLTLKIHDQEGIIFADRINRIVLDALCLQGLISCL
jgi:hypothetical protein